MNSHRNTTHESGSTLDKFESKAKQQEKVILELFQSTKEELTPFDVSALTGGQWPIQSVRRAITNLTTFGYLEKTTNLKTGGYGRRNYAWKLNNTGQFTRRVPNYRKKYEYYYDSYHKKCAEFADLSSKYLTTSGDFRQLELKFAESVTENEKLKQAVEVCHDEIEKQKKQIMQKNYEIEKLYKRIDELTSNKK